MKLTKDGIKNTAEWESKGYSLPKFNRDAVEAATKASPFWIHFGAGNIFRAFQANVVQQLLNKDVIDRGLVVAEGYDYEETKTVKRDGKVVETQTTKKHVPPDVAAINLALKNFDRDNWANDPQALELHKRELKLKERQIKNNDW